MSNCLNDLRRQSRKEAHRKKSAEYILNYIVSYCLTYSNALTYHNMGRVRTKTVKKSAKVIVEKYYSRLTLDFQVNKKVCDEIAVLPSKRMRNKIAGYITVRFFFN